MGWTPLGPVQPGFDQPTTALSASEILTVPWATIDAPFKQFGIGDTLHHPDLPPPRPYLPGSSTACQAISAVLDHPAEEVDFAPRRFGLYLSGTSFAIGTLPDGLQYYVAAGPPDTSHLDEMQKAGILQNYSGLIVLQVMDNCPFPQFLPEQRWLAAGGIYYYDPTNRGEIVLVGPVSGHVIAYRYKSANGQVDPIIHTFDFETATFT